VDGVRIHFVHERAYIADRRRWFNEEHAYSDIQSTRPQTLAFFGELAG
jgi:hypothetical protein